MTVKIDVESRDSITPTFRVPTESPPATGGGETGRPSSYIAWIGACVSSRVLTWPWTLEPSRRVAG